jgi:superfamily II DNA or RNA helicase
MSHGLPGGQVQAQNLVKGLKVYTDTDHDLGAWEEIDAIQLHGSTDPVANYAESVLGENQYFDYDSIGLVICDEVHRMAADQFAKSMWWFRAVLRMGLSATPYRKDGKEGVFLGHIGEVRLTATQEVMIPKVIIRHSEFRLPLTRRPTEGGVWRTVKLPHTAGKVGHVIKHLAACRSRNDMIGRFAGACYRKERSLIVFSDTLGHLAALDEAIQGSGVPQEDIGYYVGASTGGGVYKGNAKERKAQREQAKIKSVILATYAMASEATDIPWLDACVLASPRSDVVQIIGRIRREYPDKKQPVVLDIVDADSHVFLAYAKKRVHWYQSLGCEILVKS